mmetsp:Transcript_44326/g.65237  ORF Transcript_44326/g.65237 Transcript_44326/m.65237 type:complete len:209 (+) Transcript_44326:399-1025(+)
MAHVWDPRPTTHVGCAPAAAPAWRLTRTWTATVCASARLTRIAQPRRRRLATITSSPATRSWGSSSATATARAPGLLTTRRTGCTPTTVCSRRRKTPKTAPEAAWTRTAAPDSKWAASTRMMTSRTTTVRIGTTTPAPTAAKCSRRETRRSIRTCCFATAPPSMPPSVVSALCGSGTLWRRRAWCPTLTRHPAPRTGRSTSRTPPTPR